MLDLRALSLVLSVLGVEVALFAAFALSGLDMAIFAGVHLGLCAVVAAFGRSWAGRAGSGTVVLLVSLTLLAGPFGALVALALTVPPRAEATLAGAAPERAELTRLELLHGSLLDRRLRPEHAHDVRPLLDVILEGTRPEKFDALGLVSRHYETALGQPLRRALEDRDASVRVLAATVMAQQQNAAQKRIGALQAAAREAPERAAGWCELAEAHVDYAESGLVEPSRAAAETGRGLEYLARAMELDPADRRIPARIEEVRRLAGLAVRPVVIAHAIFGRDRDGVTEDAR